MISRYDNTLAEQQTTTTEAALGAEPVSVYAKLPEALLTQYDDIDGEEFGCFAEGQMRDFADRTHALRMEQAAPKAAPGEPSYSEKWDAELGRTAMRFVDRAGDVHPGIDDAETICAEFYKAMSEVIERMPHVQRMTPRKAAPGEQNTVPAEWLEQAYREGWAACRDAETIGQEAEDWAFGNSTANSRMIDAQQAAPKQEVQEPVAYIHVPHHTVEGKVHPVVSFEKYQQDYADGIYSTRIPLYTAPQPAPLSNDVVKDAARWQMVTLISNELRLGPEKSTHTSVVYAFMDATDNGADLTGAVDAALAVHISKE